MANNNAMPLKPAEENGIRRKIARLQSLLPPETWDVTEMEMEKARASVRRQNALKQARAEEGMSNYRWGLAAYLRREE